MDQFLGAQPVELPAAAAARDLSAEELESVPPAPSETRFQSVLYVEDNPDNLALVEQVMQLRPGIRLFAATRGRQGVDLAVNEQPGVIFLDYHLPDMNGAEVVQRLKNNESTQKIPVFMLSADATDATRKRMMDLGAIDYLTKPLDIARFLSVVDSGH